MTFHSFLFLLATSSNLVIVLLSLTGQSNGQLTFNPNAKTSEDWSLTDSKRSSALNIASEPWPEFGEYLNQQQGYQNRHQNEKKERTPQNEKIERTPLIEVLLKELARMSEVVKLEEKDPSPTSIQRRSEEKMVRGGKVSKIDLPGFMSHDY